MAFKIAGAPGAWGIEDPSNPDNPSWERVLDEVAEAGYKGLELGPYGYLPQDIEQLKRELSKRDLEVVAGTIYDNLVSEEGFATILEKTKKTCEILSKLPKAAMAKGQRFAAPYLVVIDEVNDVRSPVAGLPEVAERLKASDEALLIKHIKAIAEVAQGYGIRAVLHPHAGGYIEFADEIESIVSALTDEIGLCLDTGHLYYSGMDPAEWLKKYADRLDYVHFKDIDLAVYEDVIARRIGFFEGCAEGVMCPIGKGHVDYEKVKQALVSMNYKGWITIEQERDPRDCDGSLADAKESLAYLFKQGY